MVIDAVFERLARACQSTRGMAAFKLICVALAHDGSALVFWIDGHDRFAARWRMRRVAPDGQPWGDEIDLPHIPASRWWGAEANAPYDLSSDGRQIVLTWEQNDDIYYQRFDFNGMAISPPGQANQDTLLSSPFGEWDPWTSSPSVHMRDDGEFIIAWQDQREAEWRFSGDTYIPAGDVGEIYARRFDRQGAPMGNNFLVNADSIPRIQTQPAICMNNDGTIFCFWLETDTSSTLWFPTFARGRVIGKNFAHTLAGSGDAGSYLKPRVAASVTGFAAFWAHETALAVQAFDTVGIALGPARSVSGDYFSSYASEATGAGQYALLWSTWPANDQAKILARPFDAATGALGYERILVGDGTLSESSAASGQGIAVTYLSQQSSAVGISVADLSVLPRHTIQRLNSDHGGAAHSNPASVRLGNGNFLAVWADWRSGVAAVYGQIIDANGNKLGENVPIYAPAQHGNDQRPFAAALPDGGAVVAYRSQIQAADRTIFGIAF